MGRRGAPELELLASNFLVYVVCSDSWGCSIADGLKDTSRCHGLLALQEFQVPRPTSHPVKAPLPNCQNALLMFIDLHNILNEDVHVALCLEEECGGYKGCPKWQCHDPIVSHRPTGCSSAVVFGAVPCRRIVR